jgi:trimeric autotransporter adhesin
MIPLEELMTWFGRKAFRRVVRLLPLIPMFVLCASCSDFFVSNSSTASVAVSPQALILKAMIPATATVPAILGDTFQLSATATSVGGTTSVETSGAAWTSSSPAVATVSSAGLVSVVGIAMDGTSVITATFGGQTATSNVLTYIGAAPTTVVVNFPTNLAPAGLSPGQVFQVTATASLNNNPTHDVSKYVTWSSNSPTFATVDVNGNVSVLSTATLGATFTITATATFASGAVSGTSTTFTVA